MPWSGLPFGHLHALVVALLALPARGQGLAGAPARPGRKLEQLSDLLGAGYIDGEEIIAHWNPTFIIWSLVIAALGAYVAFTTTMYMKQVSTSKWYWIMLVQAGLALGVNTIWCMHFVGMQALVLCDGVQSGRHDMKVSITFEPVFTISSALAAWFIASIALHIALGRSPTASSTEGSKRASVDMRRLTSVRTIRSEGVRYIMRNTPVKRITSAASLVTLGVCTMHYMGMLSQTGSFSMEYHAGIICASGVVAAVAAWAGLFIFFFVFDSIAYRVAASLVVSLAVNGMHYTGMQSARYFVDDFHGIWGSSTVAWNLGAMLVLVGVLVLDFLLMAATGYYVEVLETVRKREGEAFEKELRHRSYMNSAKGLIQRSKVMRYPMCLLRYETFQRLGKLMPHEALRDANKLVYINTPHAAHKEKKKQRFIVFFSHQWLSAKIPDPKNRHFQDMLAALSGLSKVYRVKPENMYVWVDYSSIPQDGLDQQQLAIDSIATYVSVCSAFVIAAPQVLHTESYTPCNFMTYSARCWCRLEVFCSLLAAMKSKAPAEKTAILEEDEVEDSAAQDWGGRGAHGSGMPPPSPEEAVGPKALPPPPAPHGAHKAGEPTCYLQDMHRVFLVVDDQLHRLNFFNKDGTLREQYQDLLYIFAGELECCRTGHVTDDGREIPCDKVRLVDSLCGCYGAMLEELRRTRRRRSREEADDSRRTLAEHIVSQRHQIFPPDYFDTRIEAVQTQVEKQSPDVKHATVALPSGGEQEAETSEQSDHDEESDVTSSSSYTPSQVASDLGDSSSGRLLVPDDLENKSI